ncbi:hypothetical protein [Williamsia sp. 1135]|uniref:hypothetical protein n=1 Tax=Williamsia sp. 1135 TaxID=1889262 RepID=UPI000A10EF5C|nr:hypothetical protein [Williamsia sp. 1135]ORM32780.1 hypothetical protein BFL43_14780 [Williamsia sp. 1135]
MIEGDTACAALAAVIAVVVSAAVRDRAVAVVLGGTGFVVLGVIAAIDTSATWSSYGLAVATGLVVAAVGSVAANAVDRSALQASLIGGALAGAFLARPLDQYRPLAGYPGDNVPVGTPADWPLVIGATAALLLLAASWFTASKSSDSDPLFTGVRTGRALALGIAIPVASVLLWWWFIATEVLADDADLGTSTWWYGILLVPLVVGGVLWLSGRDGLVLAAVLATGAAAATVPKWQGSWPVLVVFVVLIIGGIWTGRRMPHPLVAVGMLLVCTLVNISDQSAWKVIGIIAAFVVPAAGGHLIAACLPTTAVLSTVAVTSPATLYAVTGITFGLMAAFGGSRESGFDSYAPNTTELVLSVVTIAACAAAIVIVTRRQPATDT